MPSSGEVPLRWVEDVLRAHGVELSRDKEDERITVLAKGAYVESYTFQNRVGRRILHRLKRKFDIPIHHFYHPEMAPVPPGETIQ